MGRRSAFENYAIDPASDADSIDELLGSLRPNILLPEFYSKKE
jgi:hypothetical protein